MIGAGAAEARLVPLDPGLYRVTLIPGPTSGRLPAMQVCAAVGTPPMEIAAPAAGGAWLGPNSPMLLVSAPAGGSALLTAYLADSAGPLLEVEIALLDPPGAAPFLIRFGAEAASRRVAVGAEIHIGGRGIVRFPDAARVGYLGADSWIEAITLLPGDDAAATLEYKTLAADSEETPWMPAGSPCGRAGSGIPLIGFALRQQAGRAGPVLDCEYIGSFASGATVGPARNGAPCRSPLAGDPLVGLRLRVMRRPLAG